MKEMELLRRQLERERSARRQAESILEQKAMELYMANQELRTLNERLEQTVAERTRELSASKMRLASLIANLNAGVLVEDQQRRIVLANGLFCQLFHIPLAPEQLVGLDCSDSAEQSKPLFADGDEAVTRINEILAEQQPVYGELVVMTDGRRLKRDYIPILNDGQYLGHLWHYADVTAEFQMQDALRRSEEKYRGIMENMELGLLEVDNEGRVVRAYPRFCELVGYTEAELLGKIAIDFFLPPEYLPVMERQAQERLEGQAGVYEVELQSKHRGRVWVLISGAPIFETDGRVIGSIGIHYDITKQKKLQEELIAARQRAEDAQEAEKQFLANMSHEIRTPLNAIIGMSHLLFDTEPTNEQQEYLSVLKNSAEMLRALITDVLDLAKIRSGKLEPQAKTFDLTGQVRSLIKSLQLRLQDRPVSVEFELDPSLTNMVIGDDLLINQVLHNLVGNAEKFTEKGTIRISLRCLGNTAPKGLKAPFPNPCWVEFRVADTGIGIPYEKQEIIFQSFRQVNGDIKRKFGGTGLGLSITKQIVELQSGAIRVESTPGKGSTFIVQIPYRDSGEPVTAQRNSVPLIGGKKFEGKRILVVEDNAMNRKYVNALLKRWNLNGVFAQNGVEGLEIGRRESFDLILMDIQMPEMDGYETTINLRQSVNPNQHTPIIALTASAMLSERNKAFDVGMNDYLSKPFQPIQLYEKIKQYCDTQPDFDMQNHHENGSSSNSPYHPRLDGNALAELYGEDTEYAAEMFDIFLSTVELEHETMREAFLNSDWPELARLAHKLRPSMAMVGLPDLEETLASLEKFAKLEPGSAKVHMLWNTFEQQFPQALQAVSYTHKQLSQ